MNITTTEQCFQSIRMAIAFLESQGEDTALLRRGLTEVAQTRQARQVQQFIKERDNESV